MAKTTRQSKDKAPAGPRVARGRMVSRSISTSEQLGSVTLLADYLFRACIPFLDVAGRITGNPGLIKAAVAPLRDEINSRNLPELLRQLAGAVDHNGIPLVYWYEIGGAKVLEFPGFSKHQIGLRADRESSSKFPKRNGMEKLLHSSGPSPDEFRSNSGVGPAQYEVEVEGEEEGNKRVVVDAGARDEMGGAGDTTDAADAADHLETADLASAAIKLSVAANRGLADHATKPQPIPRIMPTAGRTYQATEAIAAAGVELEFAIDAIYRLAKTHNCEDEVSSLRYFEAAVIRLWNQRGAKADSDDWIPPSQQATSSGVNGANARRASPQTIGDRSYAEATAAFDAAFGPSDPTGVTGGTEP